MYVTHVQATGRCSRDPTSRNIAPLMPVSTGIPLPDPLSYGEIHSYGAWAGPSLCQHCHLGPHRILTAPLRAGGITPWRTGGSWAQGQERGHGPCLGRTVRGGASVCLQPLSCIQVELIAREDTGCPIPGGCGASTWCLCSTAVLGPGQCTCLPGAQVTRLSVTTCCPVPHGERWAGVCAARTCPPPRT